MHQFNSFVEFYLKIVTCAGNLATPWQPLDTHLIPVSSRTSSRRRPRPSQPGWAASQRPPPAMRPPPFGRRQRHLPHHHLKGSTRPASPQGPETWWWWPAECATVTFSKPNARGISWPRQGPENWWWWPAGCAVVAFSKPNALGISWPGLVEVASASLSAEASVEYVLTVCWRSQGYILIFILKITKPYYLNFQIYVYFFGSLNPGLKKLLTIRRWRN